MKDLIEALQILMKYGNPDYPFHCEHDLLTVHGFEPEKISKEDRWKLKRLGFEINLEGEPVDGDEPDGDVHHESSIYSFKYGSC